MVGVGYVVGQYGIVVVLDCGYDGFYFCYGCFVLFVGVVIFVGGWCICGGLLVVMQMFIKYGCVYDYCLKKVQFYIMGGLF